MGIRDMQYGVMGISICNHKTMCFLDCIKQHKTALEMVPTGHADTAKVSYPRNVLGGTIHWGTPER